MRLPLLLVSALLCSCGTHTYVTKRIGAEVNTNARYALKINTYIGTIEPSVIEDAVKDGFKDAGVTLSDSASQTIECECQLGFEARELIVAHTSIYSARLDCTIHDSTSSVHFETIGAKHYVSRLISTGSIILSLLLPGSGAPYVAGAGVLADVAVSAMVNDDKSYKAAIKAAIRAGVDRR